MLDCSVNSSTLHTFSALAPESSLMFDHITRRLGPESYHRKQLASSSAVHTFTHFMSTFRLAHYLTLWLPFLEVFFHLPSFQFYRCNDFSCLVLVCLFLFLEFHMFHLYFFFLLVHILPLTLPFHILLFLPFLLLIIPFYLFYVYILNFLPLSSPFFTFYLT